MNQPTEHLQLRVTADRRHPAWVEHAYDSREHRYNPDYVNPQNWMLHMAAEVPPADVSNIEDCEWRVKAKDGSFDLTLRGVDAIEENRLQQDLRIPRTGDLQACLTVEYKDGRRQSAEDDFFLEDLLIVSIGDSYACGEGNPDSPGSVAVMSKVQCDVTVFGKVLEGVANVDVQMEKEPGWFEPLAHRSLRSGQAIATSDLEDPVHGPLVTYLTFAASGASIDKGLLQPQENWQEVGQVEEAARTAGERKVDVLLLSVGGNDVDFSWSLEELTKADVSFGGLISGGKSRQEVKNETQDKLSELPEKFDRLAEAIHDKLDPGLVLISEYPVAMFDRRDGTPGSGCEVFDSTQLLRISKQDAQGMKEFGRQLNDAIREAADRHDWGYVEGIADDFRGHGYCTEDRYYRRAEESCRLQGDFEGAMHPNQAGHSAIAGRILRILKDRFPPHN